MQKVKLSLFVAFTPEELEAVGQQLAEVIEERDRLEVQKSAAAKSFKDRIDRATLDIAELAGLVRAKGEDRMVDCVVHLHDPSQGFKSIHRLDGGEFVRTEQMTAAEMQANLFSEPEGDPAAEWVNTGELAAAEKEQGASAPGDPQSGDGTPETQEGPFLCESGPEAEDELEEEELPQPAATDTVASAAIDAAVESAIEQAKAEDPRTTSIRRYGRTSAQGVQ